MYMNGLVSQTLLSLNQDLVKLRYLSNIYKNTLEENITGVHLDTEQWHWYIFRYVRARYFQFRQLKLAF